MEMNSLVHLVYTYFNEKNNGWCCYTNDHLKESDGSHVLTG